MRFQSLSSPNTNRSSEFPEYFNLLDQTVKLINEYQMLIQNKHYSRNELGLYKVILLASLQKSKNLVLSIAHLCNLGLTEDSHTILRKLLEMTATLMYMNKDIELKEIRVKRFFNFGSVMNKRRLDEIEEQIQAEPKEGQNPRYPETIVAWYTEHKSEIIEAYERSKTYYLKNGEKEIAREFEWNWDGKSITRIITECGLYQANIPFNVLSTSTHFSIADIGVYVDLENLAGKTGCIPEDVPPQIMSCANWCSDFLDLVNSEFEIGLAAKNEQLKNRVAQILLENQNKSTNQGA